MNTHNEVPRIISENNANPLNGEVVWAPIKSIWLVSMYIIAIIGGYVTFTLSAFAVFIVLTAITLCFGHSLGMHRRLIHNSYECPKWMEYLFVHLGALVGMAGPIGMIYTHDIRDWAQRQKQCHEYFRHGKSFWHDGWWQLHCDLKLDQPPKFQLEKRIATDKVYQLMEKTWMLQQLPWALLLLSMGGVSWVVWGICVRVSVSVTGHWLIGYFAHNKGHRDWEVEDAAVQGYNIKYAGLMTMGECWHNNHHAYPGSAVLGLYEDQVDPGWWVLTGLNRLGLVWNIQLPEDLPFRENLNLISQRKFSGELIKKAIEVKEKGKLRNDFHLTGLIKS